MIPIAPLYNLGRTLLSAAKPGIKAATETVGVVAEKIGQASSAYDRARLSLMPENRREAVIRERQRKSILARIASEEAQERNTRFVRFWIGIVILSLGFGIAGAFYYSNIDTDTAFWCGFGGFMFALFGAPIIAWQLARCSVRQNPSKIIRDLRDQLTHWS